MKISNRMSINKVILNKDQIRQALTLNLKRQLRMKSFVDTDCSSVCSRKEEDICEILIETIDNQMTSEQVKTLLNLNEGNVKNVLNIHLEKENKLILNSDKICTISTIDSIKDIEQNIFKRKNKPAKDDCLDRIEKFKLEKDQIISTNNQEIDKIKKQFYHLKEVEILRENNNHFNKIELLNEEQILLVSNYNEDINFLHKLVNVSK